MKDISEYLDWLNNLSSESPGGKSKTSIAKLINLINILASRQVFEKDASQILAALDLMKLKVVKNPVKTKYNIDKCYSEVKGITAKSFGLVSKNHYQNDWISSGISIGVAIGVAVYAITKNIVFLSLGICLGIAIGGGYGSQLDKKALDEGRVLPIE